MNVKAQVLLLVAAGVSLGGGVFALLLFVSVDPSPSVLLAQVTEQTVFSSEAETDIRQSSLFLDPLGDLKSTLIMDQEDFLEVNIGNMKIRKFENGVVQQEVSILAKGDPQGWGGTPAGLYNTVAKHKAAFSSISEVYMPYAVKFYGKYYLHGEPYYAGGEKLPSGISGGCIRIPDEQVETVFNSVEEDLPIIVIDRENDAYAYTMSEDTVSAFPQISADKYLIADLESGFIFAQKNIDEQQPMASITKLMTALVVAENVDLRKSTTITENMLEAYGTTEGLEEGERFRVVELFYPLLIESSNDAAEAITGFLGRDKTIRLMNEKADAINMKHTSFEDPSGFSEENISTARDLFSLGRYVLNNRPPILEITRGNAVKSFGSVAFDLDELWNKNIFSADSTFVGGKTGYTRAANYTGVFIFRFATEDSADRDIAIILLGSQGLNTLKVDTQRAYGWLSKNYSLTPLKLAS